MRVWSDLFSVQNLFYEIFPYTPGVILKIRGQDESFGVNRKFPTDPTAGTTHAVGDYGR